MNKKLAVLLVVPILIAMGGTFAFSAFSGSSSVAINSTAGHLTWQNNLTLVETNAQNTPLTAVGPNGNVYTIGVSEPYYHSNGMYKLYLGTQKYDTATSGREYTVNVTNFAPGEYVEFMATITNNGTVGFMVSQGAISMMTSSDATYNSANAPINAAQVTASSFASDLQSSTGYIYNVTQVSGFNTSLSPEGTAIMEIWVGLGNSNGNDVNHYQGSDFTLNIDLNVVSDP
jgi:hypothetical protein